MGAYRKPLFVFTPQIGFSLVFKISTLRRIKIDFFLRLLLSASKNFPLFPPPTPWLPLHNSNSLVNIITTASRDPDHNWLPNQTPELKKDTENRSPDQGIPGTVGPKWNTQT